MEKSICISFNFRSNIFEKLCSFQMFIFAFIIMLSISAQSQVGVNTTMPDPTAALDVTSTTRGLLVPRMLQSEKIAIGSPAQGLLIYQTDQTKGFYYYDNGWIFINSAGIQGPQGVAGANGKNAMALTSALGAGPNCATGGTKLEVGVDANGNNILESNEINNSLTRFICNGAAGSSGSIAKTTNEPAGANCAKGGVKLEFGVDANSNNTLDPSEVNAALTKYVCNGNSLGYFDHYIGEAFGGGVIFHLWKEGAVEHGLIVCQTGLVGNGAPWSNVSSTFLGATSKWNGLSNCNAIIGQAGHSLSAAGLALNFTSNTATDWYLPSYAEMNLLWTNYFNVSKTISDLGATEIPLFTYWTSTEDNNNSQAFAFNMFSGTPQVLPKSTSLNIIAIRKF